MTAAGCVGMSAARAGGGGVTTTADGRLNSPVMTMPSPTASTASAAAAQRAILKARPECHAVGPVVADAGTGGSSISVAFGIAALAGAAGAGASTGFGTATGPETAAGPGTATGPAIGVWAWATGAGT